jgi:N-methylhydantoinase A
MKEQFCIGVDIGGTFVDAVEFDRRAGTVRLAKAPTTPGRPWEGVLHALDRLATPLEAVDLFIHGTTLGLNAVLERRGALTGVITNDGLRDIFVIGRSNVPDHAMYDFQYEQPPLIVRRRDTVGVRCRLDAEGRELEALDEDGVRAAARFLVESQQVEAIAICFLHSYRNPAHERRAAEIVRAMYPTVAVSASFEIAREYREYERTSTTVIDAYIRPILAGYIDELSRALRERGFAGRFLVMRSGGGAMTSAEARKSPTHTILSGPAGGIVGAARVATVSERSELLTFDTGGTSLDLCVIERGVPVTRHEAELERYPLLIPIYDIRTLGAGGGSIATVEDGLLRVGPRSAGAEPGPIAYGRGGTEPTVTDAAIALGYIDAERFLGGAMPLDAVTACAEIERLIGKPLGLSLDGAAVGVFRVLLAKTVGAVRQVTIERGRDPRTFSLLAFGGAGPLLAPLLARELEIREVIVPVAPAAFSAWGMLSADIVNDFARTELRRLDDLDLSELEGRFGELELSARRSLVEQGVAESEIVLTRQLDLRYEGQEHSLTLPIAGDLCVEQLRAAFEAEHERRYGHIMDSPVQVLAVRVRGGAKAADVSLPTVPEVTSDASDPLLAKRVAWCFARNVRTEFSVYDRSRLRAGHCLDGPAIVDEGTSTTVVMSDQRLQVDDHGQLLITRKGQHA